MSEKNVRTILGNEEFKTESCTHFKWVIEKYISIGDADKAVAALDAFFDTFFPKPKDTPAEPIEPQAKQEEKKFMSVRELAFAFVDGIEKLSAKEQASVVKSLGRRLSQAIPPEEYVNKVGKDSSGAKVYSIELEQEIVDIILDWDVQNAVKFKLDRSSETVNCA